MVATVLTVYGIETVEKVFHPRFNSKLQQYLPFTVLKHLSPFLDKLLELVVATVLTVYGIETEQVLEKYYGKIKFQGCNSTYRLRY